MSLSKVYCPETLYGTGCREKGCPLKHDARLCNLCAIICPSASTYTAHLNGRRHRASLERTPWLHCRVCNIQVFGYEVWKHHVSAAPHQRKAAHLGLQSPPVEPDAPPLTDGRFKRCGICDIVFNIASWGSHIAGAAHQRQQQHATLRSAFERAESDKQGITVSHPDTGLDFGLVELANSTEGVCIELSMSANASSQDISVVRMEVHARLSNHSTLFNVDLNVPKPVPAGGPPVILPVRFCHNKRGRYEARLEITFEGQAKQPFIVTRKLRVVVGDVADRELLKPVAPYVRRRRAPWRDDVPTLSGDSPPTLPAPWVTALPAARVPSDLAAALKKGSPEDVLARIRERYFTDPLSLENHASLFATLLWIEECRMAEDLRMYDMTNTEISSTGRLHTLRVEGLAEKRPSVVRGDAIKVQSAGTAAKETHKGIVHDIAMDHVHINFHNSFVGTGRRFNVCFSLNRTPLRRQHQALTVTCPASRELLFPLPGHEGVAAPLHPTASPVTLYNAAIGNNAAQLQAVRTIINLREGSAAFIVFGPPGTGKTVTIVEAIRQVLKKQPNARILACAPSNSAADIIAQRLTMLSPEELFRCNAACREPLSVPAELLPYVNVQGHFYGIPSIDKLSSYRVIVSTCGNASFAYNVGMPEGHFTHIFVDEAGQASEPEVLNAIKTVAVEKTRVVLSGDPKQLGPVIRSAVAREFGLGKSLLERLMERPVYSTDYGRGTSFIKLVKNYRSHEAILTYPNQQFYDGDLEVCGALSTINSFIGSPQLATPKFPVLFHAISGENERESTSPSYFNIDEATQVKAYVVALLADRRFPIHGRDIGVIAPYHAQVRKIRKLLQQASLTDVKVGSVEEFQGQERRVIIISTVRSSAELLSYDKKFTLGFLSNPRRFNVAVTRAQALLIVIGDASVLSIDPLWRGFMNYVYHHHGWRGDPPAWDVNAPVLEDADYAKEIREAAAADMDAFMVRVAAGEDVEGEANVDVAFQGAD